MIYFREGKEVQRERGSKEMKDLSKWVEELLETIRPGSRKEGGPKLPKAGDKAVEAGPDKEEVVKEKVQDEVKDKEAASSKLESLKNEPTKEPTKAATPTPTPAKATPVKAVSTYNPSGISDPLTAEKFQSAITNTHDAWFVKFYAPWCHHCQALKPNWDNMARQMKGKLNVGEVDCDVEKRLCKDAKVRGYPTMLFFRGGERIEYEGLRGLGDLLDYANKASSISGGVEDVDAAAFKALEEKEEVVFVYFYDHATTSEDFAALDRLTLSLVGKAKIVKTSDKAMSERFKISTWPRLMVSRDGKPTYYPPITPKEMRDTRQVLTWMKSVWLPLVPELTSSNAKDIMDGKIVVLGILSRERSDEFILSKREMKSAAIEWIDKQDALFQLERKELRDAKQLRIEEAEDKDDERALRDAKGIRINMDEIERPRVGFAWVDGVFWERWVKTTYGVDVKEGERVIINDEDVSDHSTPSSSPIHTDHDCRTAASGTPPSPASPSGPAAPPSSRPSTRSRITRRLSRPNPPRDASQASSSHSIASRGTTLCLPFLLLSASLSALCLPARRCGDAATRGTSMLARRTGCSAALGAGTERSTTRWLRRDDSAFMVGGQDTRKRHFAWRNGLT